MKSIQKLISSAVLMITLIAFTSSTAQNTNTSRYGVQAGIFAQTPISNGTIGVFADITYQYDGVKFSDLPAHQLEGVGGLSVALSDEAVIAIGAGYKQNLTYERGQPVLYLGVQHEVFSITGKLLLSEFEQYNNNYEVIGMLYPGRDIFGVGVFYNKEYNCNVVGLKLQLRIFEGGSGSGGGSSRPCRGCR